jgi:hypothetical protein
MMPHFYRSQLVLYCGAHCWGATYWLALALLPPMLQVGQPRPRAASRRAWRTVGSHWLMFFQLPAMQSRSLQPSTACAGALSPGRGREQGPNRRQVGQSARIA